MHRTFQHILLVMAATAQLALAGVVCAELPHLEYEVKAAFVYNFAKFVEWPRSAFADKDAPLVFCIIGRDPFNGELEHIVDGRSANGRRIVVRDDVSVSDGKACHLAFVPATEDEHVARIVPALHSAPGATILTVGETDKFAAAGGMIRLFLEAERVRFDIDTVSAERAGLKVSSHLLKLARDVRTETESGTRDGAGMR